MTDKPTIPMYFPKRVVLTLDPALVGPAENQWKDSKIVFEAGVQPVPLVLASHRWLKYNGAVAYTGQPIPADTSKLRAMKDEVKPAEHQPPKSPSPVIATREYEATEKDVAFLHAHGYPVNGIQGAQTFVDKMDSASFASYVKDIEENPVTSESSDSEFIKAMEKKDGPGGPDGSPDDPNVATAGAPASEANSGQPETPNPSPDHLPIMKAE